MKRDNAEEADAIEARETKREDKAVQRLDMISWANQSVLHFIQASANGNTNEQGVYLHGATFHHVVMAFAQAGFNFTHEKIRRRIATWRGGRHNVLPEYPPVNAWLDRDDGGLFFVTDFALKKMGMADVVRNRQRRQSVHKKMFAAANADAKRYPPKEPRARQDRRALAWFLAAHPDGGGLDDLYIALVGAGSLGKRKITSTYADVMVRAGLLIRIGFAQYMVKPDLELPEAEFGGEAGRLRIVACFSLRHPTGGDLADLRDVIITIDPAMSADRVANFASEQAQAGLLQPLTRGRYIATLPEKENTK